MVLIVPIYLYHKWGGLRGAGGKESPLIRAWQLLGSLLLSLWRQPVCWCTALSNTHTFIIFSFLLYISFTKSVWCAYLSHGQYVVNMIILKSILVGYVFWFVSDLGPVLTTLLHFHSVCTLEKELFVSAFANQRVYLHAGMGRKYDGKGKYQ